MKSISPLGIPVGVSIIFWSLMGILRFITETISSFTKKRVKNKYKAKDVAVIVPAHNEELVIKNCVRALKRIVDKKQIYVVSDGSSDKTYRRARTQGCHVSSLTPGRGKAKALIYLIKRFKLFAKYKLIFIVDADTLIDRNFLLNALPYFNDPNTAVVFGSAKIKWPKHFTPKLGLYYVAYREKLNFILRYLLIYGQTWKYTNVNFVIPGFATIYRSNVLSKLEIDTPGLLIEDFNLAFQLHKRKLGKIAHDPSIIGWDQHPDNLSDYWKQVRRWNIGYFQTVRKNGFWPSFFWLSMIVFTIEVFTNSLFILFLPFILIAMAIFSFNFYLSFYDILILFFFLDYLTTCTVGLISNKPNFFFYGVYFFFLHYITSLILLSAVIPGFFKSSSGVWSSPKRQSVR